MWPIAAIVATPIAAVIALGMWISARREDDPKSADLGKEALAIVSGATGEVVSTNRGDEGWSHVFHIRLG
jgi:hypothetical protein